MSSVAASVAFAALFGIPGMFEGLDPFAVFGWRVLAALPFVAIILTLLRQWGAMATILRRIRRHPSLALVLVVDGLLFGLQMWLFAYGPMTDNALAVSLGYFLLPLAVVAVGVTVLREKLTRVRGIAVALATVGVAVAIATGASISWATFAVALGYPAYFILRRRYRLDSPAALGLEFLTLVPISLVFVLQPAAIGAVVSAPANVGPIVLLGALTALGFSAYTLAQKHLPLTLFGLLGYLEPILLVVVSVVLLGEPLGIADSISYVAIGAALVALVVDGLSKRGHTPRPKHSRRAKAPAGSGAPDRPRDYPRRSHRGTRDAHATTRTR